MATEAVAIADASSASVYESVRDTGKRSSTEMQARRAAEPPRLFVVCGRGRKVEELREMFGSCGAIRHLHLATDRSNKSRGFAFLQYDDPASADEAIKQFDHLTLSDGHVLKVTVAREKSAGTSAQSNGQKPPGKLKRNQIAHDENDEAESRARDSSSVDGGMLPGKRQRSSPPVGASTGALVESWKRVAPLPTKVAVYEREDVEGVIAGVVHDIICAIESSHGVMGSVPTFVPSVNGPTAKRKAHSAVPTTSSENGESSADDVTSCTTEQQIDDGLMKPKAQRTSKETTPNRHSRRAFMLRQRHVSIDESDSSVDDGSDASVGRRKRSNTEPDLAELTSRRKLSDLSELSLSPAGISSPATSKKRCNRKAARPLQSLAAYGPAPVPTFVSVRPPPQSPVVRTELFFTSTYKFTAQELHAMFSIYDKFESVKLAKTFGRIKTMAYVKYSTPSAANAVLVSFLEDYDKESAEVMKLTFAESKSATAFPFRQSGSIGSAPGEPTSSEVLPALSPAGISSSTPARLWVMILYDRTLSKESISSCVSDCDGMEFVDIKLFRSTGESQGVAFVKFEAEEHAITASHRLHGLELPEGCKKYLQAMAIADPSLFSTPHGTTAKHSHQHAHSFREDSTSAFAYGEDGELGAVEERFAHLMSSGEQHRGTATASTAVAVPADDSNAEFGYAMAPPASTMFIGQQASHMGTSAAPFGYFQLGQPFPTTIAMPTYGYHPMQQQQMWGYDGFDGHMASYPLWPGHPGSASPIHPDYGHFSWEPEFSASSSQSSNEPLSQLADATSVYVSSARPLDHGSLMKAIQDCAGVVGFTKQERDGIAFVVDFAEPHFAADAARKLDGSMCNGHKLRVAVASSHRAPPSRRKRQRLDPRGRK